MAPNPITCQCHSFKISLKGKHTVETKDFVAQLEKVNWNWSLHEANQWIENNIHTFKDISTEEGGALTERGRRSVGVAIFFCCGFTRTV